MKLKSLLEIKWLGEFLNSQLGYFNGSFYGITPNGFVATNKVPRVLVLARTFYNIDTKEYPSISKQELKKLLNIKKRSATSKVSFTSEAKPSIDGFVVTQIELKNLPEELSSTPILIPETALFPDNAVAEVSMSNNILYVGNGVSIFQGGLISSIDAFKHSVGFTGAKETLTLTQESYSAFLYNTISEMSFEEARSCSLLNKGTIEEPLKLHSLYVLPTLSTFIFLVATLGWSEWQRHEMETKSELLGQEVDTLLKNKNTIDRNNQQITAIKNATQRKAFIHDLWPVLYEATEKGFHLDRLMMDDGVFELSGRADNANSILKAISEMDGIYDAAFTGGVRKLRGSDNFTVRFQMRGHDESN